MRIANAVEETVLPLMSYAVCYVLFSKNGNFSKKIKKMETEIITTFIMRFAIVCTGIILYLPFILNPECAEVQSCCHSFRLKAMTLMFLTFF